MTVGVRTDLDCCPRCLEPHRGLPVEPVNNPLDEWDHWTLCPKTDQPVHIRITVMVN